VSPALSACSTVLELFSEVGDTVAPHLGFERFAAYRAASADGVLDARSRLSDADRGLYGAKQGGRDRTVDISRPAATRSAGGYQ